LPRTDIIFKVFLGLITVIGFLFAFLSYIIALRPQIQAVASEYTLVLIEGGVIVFVFTASPLTYAYLVEREKKKRKS